ncbi:MAG: DEAD/DEAH box helicase [bacterium]|nr:DEAD/DEAH box helicase [bacterium]
MSNNETFYGLGIAPNMLKRLDELKFVTPTPIQMKAIPIGIRGEDMIGIAQTGTGKTLAFSIPMIQRLAAAKSNGLVICPTRELAIQVDETLQKIGGPFKLRTALIIGGANMNWQVKAIQRRPHIIVATPGRLIDHLEQKTISLKQVGVLVLDEADRMLDMGFEPQIKKILLEVPEHRQTMLFSATMPAKIAQMARSYMKSPLRVEVAPSGTTAELVEQELFVVPRNQKLALLEKILEQYSGTVLVFCRTKFGAKKVTSVVNKMGHRAAEIHGNRTQNQRMSALEGFKSGRYRVLVATDIAARGIDVTGIELVVNYDLPENSEDYVHRIGRTARAGSSGKAISFACPEQSRDVNAIENLIKIRLPITPLPKLEEKAYLVPSRDDHSEGRFHSNRSENGRPRRPSQGSGRRSPGGSGRGGRGRW